MILLTATTETLKLITANAYSVDWTEAHADLTATAFTPGSNQGNVAAAATTTIVAAPLASTQRQVKLLTVRNAGNGVQTVTIKKDVSGTVYAMTPDVALAAGEVLEYLDGQGFRVLDPFGQAKVSADSLIVDEDGSAVDTGTLLSDILAAIKETNEFLFEMNERAKEAISNG